ncbi:MAG: hypothetical protein ACTSPR_02920 [Candidatus Thorarchaeota archaeon]
MNALSKKGRSPKSSKLVFVHKIADLSSRGDIEAITELLKSYWKDKRAHPWHRLYALIETQWEKENPSKDLQETLILLRDAIFGSLEMLSLSLALNIPASEVLAMVCKGATWKDGRRLARAECSTLAMDLIDKGDLGNLTPSALERDGMGFLLAFLHEAHLKEIKMAKPTTKDGKLDLKALSRTMYGRRLLREKTIAATSIDESDPVAVEILETYDNLILELEIEDASRIIPVRPTEQVTLNGKLVEDSMDKGEIHKMKDPTPSVQAPLTEYLTVTAKGLSSKVRKRKTSKKKRSKKSSAKKKGGRK